jgi:hypothetical protein
VPLPSSSSAAAAATAAAPPPPPPAIRTAAAQPPKHLVSINSAGLKWHAIVSPATVAAVAGCVYEMMHKVRCTARIAQRSGACA